MIIAGGGGGYNGYSSASLSEANASLTTEAHNGHNGGGLGGQNSYGGKTRLNDRDELYGGSGGGYLLSGNNTIGKF